MPSSLIEENEWGIFGNTQEYLLVLCSGSLLVMLKMSYVMLGIGLRIITYNFISLTPVLFSSPYLIL